MAPSARAFGAGLRPWPSATISYHLCNFWHPGTDGRRRGKVPGNLGFYNVPASSRRLAAAVAARAVGSDGDGTRDGSDGDGTMVTACEARRQVRWLTPLPVTVLDPPLYPMHHPTGSRTTPHPLCPDVPSAPAAPERPRRLSTDHSARAGAAGES
eukprot:scaffold16916_cov49-Phaeocystis_antarctica.AAC.5